MPYKDLKMDPKVIAGTLVTASGATMTWLEPAHGIASLLLTVGGVVVAVLTAVYTWERIRELRGKKNVRNNGAPKD